MCVCCIYIYVCVCVCVCVCVLMCACMCVYPCACMCLLNTEQHLEMRENSSLSPPYIHKIFIFPKISKNINNPNFNFINYLHK